MPKYVEFIEPKDESCQDFNIVRVPVAEAIRSQKMAGAQRGFVYQDDEKALDDFVVCCWGKVIEPCPTYDPLGAEWCVSSPWLMKLREHLCRQSSSSFASSRWVCPSGFVFSPF